MPDWTEHSTTLVVVLLAIMGVLGRLIWSLWCKREQEKESLVAKALERVGQEISQLRCELKGQAAEIFGRLNTSEQRIAAVQARCEAIHGDLHRGMDDGK